MNVLYLEAFADIAIGILLLWMINYALVAFIKLKRHIAIEISVVISILFMIAGLNYILHTALDVGSIVFICFLVGLAAYISGSYAKSQDKSKKQK